MEKGIRRKEKGEGIGKTWHTRLFQFLLLFPFSFLLCCTAVRTERYALPAPAPVEYAHRFPVKTPRAVKSCTDWQAYVPDTSVLEQWPVRLLRVNFHVMDNTARSAHRPADSVDVFLRRLLDYANADLDTNERSWRAAEDMPTLPKRYRYVLTPQPRPGDTGIYFHYDDDLYYFVSEGKYQNNYKTEVIKKYGIGTDSIINIFLQVHPRDSFGSKTYRPNGQGIALGTSLKMAGVLESKEGPESFEGLLNHEIGHILTLSHAWTEDGCPDTQNHPNKCWAWEEQGPCNRLATNNMMDYNAYQVALTPCQIGKVHALFANEKSNVRRCLLPTWCERKPENAITIRDSVTWTGARDLEGDVTIAPGGALYLACRVSFPAGARLVVQPGGHLWLDGARLHNACGDIWEGVMLQNNGKIAGQVHIVNQPVFENLPPPSNH